MTAQIPKIQLPLEEEADQFFASKVINKVKADLGCPAFKDNIIIRNIVKINNIKLENRFNSTVINGGHLDRFGYLHVGDLPELNDIVSNGLKCGGFQDAFGVPDEGAYVHTASDMVVSGRPFRDVPYRVVMFKINPGRTKKIGFGSCRMYPEKGYNSYALLPKRNQFSQVSRTEIQNFSLLYMFELDKDNMAIDRPSRILPYAHFHLIFTDNPRPGLLYERVYKFRQVSIANVHFNPYEFKNTVISSPFIYKSIPVGIYPDMRIAHMTSWMHLRESVPELFESPNVGLLNRAYDIPISLRYLTRHGNCPSAFASYFMWEGVKDDPDYINLWKHSIEKKIVFLCRQVTGFVCFFSDCELSWRLGLPKLDMQMHLLSIQEFPTVMGEGAFRTPMSTAIPRPAPRPAPVVAPPAPPPLPPSPIPMDIDDDDVVVEDGRQFSPPPQSDSAPAKKMRRESPTAPRLAASNHLPRKALTKCRLIMDDSVFEPLPSSQLSVIQMKRLLGGTRDKEIHIAVSSKKFKHLSRKDNFGSTMAHANISQYGDGLTPTEILSKLKNSAFREMVFVSMEIPACRPTLTNMGAKVETPVEVLTRLFPSP